MLLSELEDLKDVLDTLVFEDDPSIFDEDCAIELLETALHLMEEYINFYPHVISEPDFQEILLEEIKDIFYIQMEDHIEELYNGDDIEDDMNELLDDALNIFISSFYPDKIQNNKVSQLFEYNLEEINMIEEKIQKLREIPQPEQRTPEWYQFRWNLITASNAWKAFETQSAINQLIYEKCQPLKSTNEDNVEEEPVKMVNVNTPLHWGQKYEPLSVLIYEQKYNTKVEDFGCIKHHNYSFLGASPDGINVDINSERYGRMLEIKNVVSREINGIPKKEYWTQMQLQMEVCDLDECDFLETKFIEYPDTQSFYNDTFTDENGSKNITLSVDNKNKGIILYFHTKEGKPFYIYKPINITNNEDITCWEESEVEKYENAPYNYIFFKFIYWKLEVLSCVLVLRNREWFKNNIGQLANVWKTIEEERVSGYDHRAPKKNPKKETFKPFVNNTNDHQGCLLKFNKIIKVDTKDI
jgi:putative phage-type endonuclease